TAYLKAVDAGQPPDRQELLTRYPDLTPGLTEFFTDQDRMDRLATPLREVVSPRTSAPRPDPVAGSTLAELGQLGDFRLVREVGRGGMGVVYEAEQVSLRRRVALKVLPLLAMLDPKQLQRFQNEAQAAAQLHHTNIVPVYFVGCERGVHYYAMQYI